MAGPGGDGDDERAPLVVGAGAATARAPMRTQQAGNRQLPTAPPMHGPGIVEAHATRPQRLDRRAGLLQWQRPSQATGACSGGLDSHGPVLPVPCGEMLGWGSRALFPAVRCLAGQQACTGAAACQGRRAACAQWCAAPHATRDTSLGPPPPALALTQATPAAQLGGLLFGYDIGATSGSLPSLTSAELSGTDW